MSDVVSEDAVKDAIAETLGIDRSRLDDDTMQLVDLVDDSFRLVELSVDLQDRFGVLFDRLALGMVFTVGDLVRLVQTAPGVPGGA